MNKRFLSFMTAAALSLSAILPASAITFSDVTSNYDWAEEAIYDLADAGIIKGYPEGTFMPGKNITKEEAVTLFARTLGSSDEDNEVILNVASTNAKSALAKFDTYAKDQAAYLMYKNVLSADDLSTYLSSSNKSKTLKRYEAATLIAKCLGGDVWLKSNPDVTLSFADSDTVPSSAVGYVYYASELGIIKGMEGNKFEPSGDVTRAQIATMIKRIFDLMSFEYMPGTISDIDEDLGILSVKYTNGESDGYNINKSVAVMLDGAKSQLSLLDIGMEVVVTFSDGNLYSIDAVSVSSTEEIVGVYRGKTSDNSVTYVKISPIGSSDSKTYELAENVVISYNGKSGSLGSFVIGNQVNATLKFGKVTLLSAKPKAENVSGAIVKSIDVSDDVYITVTTNDNEEVSYPVSSSAKVKRNNVSVTLSEIAVGDMVNLALEYDKVSEINATGKSKSLSGTVEGITISSTAPTISIKSGSDTKQYTVARDAVILLDGKEASIYDLRIGYTLSFKTTSSQITDIDATSTSAAMLLSGEITLVNSAYGMVKIEYVDNAGNLIEKQIFVKDNAKIVDSNNPKVKSISNLEVGMNIAVTGTETLGIYEATTVMVLSTNE